MYTTARVIKTTPAPTAPAAIMYISMPDVDDELPVEESTPTTTLGVVSNGGNVTVRLVVVVVVVVVRAQTAYPGMQRLFDCR